MRKFCFALMMLLLAGCAGGKPAYQSQSAAASAGAQKIQSAINALAADVSKSCAGDEFKARFDGLDIALDALRVQINNITFAADAEFDAMKLELQKRNISLIGLAIILIAMVFYGIKMRKF